MTPAPSNVPPPPPRPLDRRDPNQPPARGTRGAGYGEEAGAPLGDWPEGSAATEAPAPAKAPPVAPVPPALYGKGASAPKTVPVPVPGATVRKSVPPAPKPPVPLAFPPEALRAECEALIARYPSKERIAALIPILHLAQKRLGGWISPELEAGIAAYLGCSDQHVRGVLTFYTMFNTKPVGRHHVQVCRTLSCWLRGAKGLTKAVESKAGIRCGETDKDGRFTLTEVECLGLCEVAPVIHVNDTPHVSLTPETVSALLDGLK